MVEKEKYLAFQNLSMSGCTVEKGAKTGLTKVGEGGGDILPKIVLDCCILASDLGG